MKQRNFLRKLYRKFATTIFYFIAIFTISLIFCGCPANLKIIANSDKSFSLEFNLIFGEKLVCALEDLSQISAQFSENAAIGDVQNQSQNFDLSQIIDTKKIEDELSAQLFSQSQVTIQRKSEKAYNFIASAKIKNIARFPKECLSQEEMPGGKKRVVLMSPLVTGEDMSAEEYEDLLSEIYGKGVASELLSGKFKVDFVCPNGKILSQEIPIANLLASNETIDFVFEY